MQPLDRQPTGSAPVQPATPQRPSLADVVVALFLTPNPVRALLSIAIFLALAAVFVNRAVQTRFFGIFTIVHAPYYRELAGDIAREPAFERRIGTPIVVDDASVWCPRIAIGATTSTSQCHLPVRGSRGSGDVFAQARFSNGSLSADLTLLSGTTEDHARI